MAIEQKAVTESALVLGMVAAPAWAPWLGDLNQLLTTLTLVVGLALGVGRQISFLKDRKKAD